MYPVRYIEKVNSLHENIEIPFVYTGGGYAYSASNRAITVSEKEYTVSLRENETVMSNSLIFAYFLCRQERRPYSPVCPF